ncbi:MAG: TonB family protein [Bacteroidota bacterium]
MNTTSYLIAFLVYALTAFSGFGQDTTYYNSLGSGMGTTKAKADHYLIRKDSAGFQIDREYYMDDQTKAISLYKKEGTRLLPYGQKFAFHPNGQLASVYTYNEEGTRSGPAKSYYEDGQLSFTGAYVDWKKDGEWIHYHQNGQKSDQKTFIAGKGKGKIMSWHENSQVRYEASFNRDGVFVLDNAYRKDGSQVITNGEGEWTEYTASGKLLYQGSYDNGLKTGIWYIYDTLATGSMVSGTSPILSIPFTKGMLDEDITIKIPETGKIINFTPKYLDAPDDINPLLEAQPVPINMDIVKRLIGYPKVARDNGIQGMVVVRVLVDETGAYEDHILINQVAEELSTEVEQQLPQLKFTPAIQNGRPIKFWVNIPFNFKLIDDYTPLWKKRKKKKKKKGSN